jgi:hypothetical protein
MLKHMGEARLSPGLIPGSHTVPDLKGDKGRFVIFKKDHLQAVWQNGFENLLSEPGLGKWYGETVEKKDEKS